jgi:transcriptional regulator with XRE-family HTH domain
MSRIDDNIGLNVAAARMRQHQSVDELAAATGLSSLDLQLIESATVRVSPRQLRLLADTLKVSYEHLLYPIRAQAGQRETLCVSRLRDRVVSLVNETEDKELLMGIAALLRAERAEFFQVD